MKEKEVSFTKKGFNKSNALCMNGTYFDIGVPVIKWDDPEGLNSYDTSKHITFEDDRKTGKKIKKVVNGKRYGKRKGGVAAIRQIVQHHTGGFTAQQAFQTLHNERKLSVQFLTDIKDNKGVVYQPLDAAEQAWQAGDLNNSSVGIENVLFPSYDSSPGAYDPVRCRKFGLVPHEVDKVYIQGSTHEVFLLPDEQINVLISLTAGIWASLNYFDILSDDNSPPLFMTDKSGKPLMDYSPNYKNHKGMMLHANSKSSKWDLAGLADPTEFERKVSEKFYEFISSF